MFVCKMNTSLFRLRGCTTRTSHFMYYHGKIDTVAKRGSMLEQMIINRDKRKNWLFHLQGNIQAKPKVRIFDQVHKPHRRRIVLNSLFIKNITDVLSTGEIVPELIGSGIEITGVQISPCAKLLNVFWQVPVSKFDNCEDIAKLLAIAAPKIRGELISRNVMGRVPFIFFLRDSTNSKVAEFEEAMKRLELEPKVESSIVVDDSFLDDMYSFKESKEDKKVIEPIRSVPKENPTIPQAPLDMKCNIFGLDHGTIMEKVIALKKKRKNPPQNSAVVFPEHLENEDDLFSKIPGVCFRTDSSDNIESRKAILKKFHVARKMLKLQLKTKVNEDTYDSEDESEDESESNSFDDYIEENYENP